MKSSMQKKKSWKHVAYFFVGWRTYYCASEKLFCKSVCHEGPPRPTPSPKPREKPPFHLRGPPPRRAVCNDISKPIPWKDAKNALIHTNPEARAFFMRAL